MKPFFRLISTIALTVLITPYASQANENNAEFYCKSSYEKRIRRDERLGLLKYAGGAVGAGLGAFLTSRISTYNGTTGQSLSPAQGGDWTPLHLLVGALLVPGGAMAGYEITSETVSRRPKAIQIAQAYAFLKVITGSSESDSSTEKYLELISGDTRVDICGRKSPEASECWSLIRAQILKVSQTDRFCSNKQLMTLTQLIQNLL